MAIKPGLVPITKHALTQRITRKLRAQGKKLVTRRPNQRERSNAGYYVVSKIGSAKRWRTLDALGRELGVLQPYERLARRGLFRKPRR